MHLAPEKSSPNGRPREPSSDGSIRSRRELGGRPIVATGRPPERSSKQCGEAQGLVALEAGCGLTQLWAAQAHSKTLRQCRRLWP